MYSSPYSAWATYSAHLVRDGHYCIMSVPLIVSSTVRELCRSCWGQIRGDPHSLSSGGGKSWKLTGRTDAWASLFFFFLIFVYLFPWLCQLLVVA